MPLREVACLVLPGVVPFELGVVCEVFGIDRSDDGLPVMGFTLVTPHPGPVRMSVGVDLDIPTGLEGLAGADLVCVPATDVRDQLGEPVLQALRDAVARGAEVLSVCSGSFALGQAGLLDGRRCTSHWMHTTELAEQFPAALVDPHVLFVQDGPVITSAGTAAGIDACLHVVRRHLGSRVAAAIARRMVVPPQRDGGQAQYVETPVPECSADTLEPLLQWMVEHLDQDLSVEALARRASLSARTLARRFRAETGTTPLAWVVTQRVLLAQRLLEDTDMPVEQVASHCGFGTAPVLRHHFQRRVGTTPQGYRRTFRTLPA